MKQRFMKAGIPMSVAILCVGLFGCAAPGGNTRADYSNVFDVPNESEPWSSRVSSAAGQEEMVRAGRGTNVQGLPERKMTAAEHESLGDGYYGRGELQPAFVHYEKALKLEPENHRVQYKKGLLFLEGKMHREAMQTFEDLVKKAPDYALGYEGLGRTHFYREDYAKAEEYLHKALKLDPQLWSAYNLLGVILDYKKNHARATYEYRKAIALNPDNGMLYNNLGVSYALLGNNEEAVEAFRDGVRKAAVERKKIYNNLGVVLAKMGRYQEALDAFRKGGDEAKAYNNLGCAYQQQGQTQKAVRCFEKAIEVSPAYYALAGENLQRAKGAQLSR
jgi:Flp pilus assembly protein TadD